MENKKEFQPGIIFGGVHSDVASIHGGYTTSYGIRFISTTGARTGIIVDNGTGVVNVCRNFDQYKFDKVILLQTHYHMDHIAGIHQNSYLKDGVTFAGFRHYSCTPGHLITEFFDSRYSAVPKPSVEAVDLYLHHKSDFEVNNGISKILLSHPAGGSLGYRISTPLHGDVVIATDCELCTPRDQLDFATFIENARYVILDMKYLDDEYEQHVGWGHNSPRLIGETLVHAKGLRDTKFFFVHHNNKILADNDTRRKQMNALKAIGFQLIKINDSYKEMILTEDNMNVAF